MNLMDVQLLAGHVMGYHSEEDQEKILNGEIDIEEEFFDKHGLDMLDHFAKVADMLLPFTVPAKTPLTGDIVQGWLAREYGQAAFVYKKDAVQHQDAIPNPLEKGQLAWLLMNFRPAQQMLEKLPAEVDHDDFLTDLYELVKEVERRHGIRSMMEHGNDEATDGHN